MKLIAWVKKTPQPSYFVADGKRIEVGDRGSKWADIVRTITTLGASKLEAYSRDGALLRAVTLDTGDDDDAPEDEKSKAAKGNQCAHCGASLAHFATLLADAYQRGAQSQAQAYGVSFTENTNLVTLLANRLHSVEGAWQKLIFTNARLVAESGVVAEDTSDPLLQALILGAQQAKQAQAAQPAQAQAQPQPAQTNGQHVPQKRRMK